MNPRLWRYIGAPRRLLRRAREVYVGKMVILDEKVRPITNISGFPPLAPPPPYFGGNYWTINHSTCTHKEAILRTESDRITSPTIEEFDVSGLDEVRHCYSSLGLGRVATIEEDRWYEFDEEVNIRIDLHLSRSKSQAIGRRSVGGYY